MSDKSTFAPIRQGGLYLFSEPEAAMPARSDSRNSFDCCQQPFLLGLASLPNATGSKPRRNGANDSRSILRRTNRHHTVWFITLVHRKPGLRFDLKIRISMKIIILFFSIVLSVPTWAQASCFLVKENNRIVQKNGDCKKRHAPCSTFKIALSLMGYDAGILIDEINPKWPFKKNYLDWLDQWKQPHTPEFWMKNSCVWYSQVLTKKLGMLQFKAYIKKFNYGNQDVSGDKGKNNGLTHSWLSSSLEISPEEQTIFLQSLTSDNLPVSHQAHEMTKKILFLENLPEGWQLFGKTGSGNLLSEDRMQKLNTQHGWFIGWLQKGKRVVVFANHIVDDVQNDTCAGPRAKEIAKKELLKIIQERRDLR